MPAVISCFVAHVSIKNEKHDNISGTIKTYINYHVSFCERYVRQYAKIHQIAEGYDDYTQRLCIFSWGFLIHVL